MQILFPICDGGNWSLTIVDSRAKTVRYFDPRSVRGESKLEFIKRSVGASLSLKGVWDG